MKDTDIFFAFLVAGKVIKFEVLNIPWSDQLLNYTSDVFANAKYIVEEAVSILTTVFAVCISSIVQKPLSFTAGFGLH